MISVIVPCFNEENNISQFYKVISSVAEKMMQNTAFEFIFINDGSTDGTLTEIKIIAEVDQRVKYIDFSRNFGKESAMMAGFEASTGDYVAVIDADLQDPPELLIEMFDIISTGDYDRVATRRTTRKGEPIIRSFFARMFYKLINKISDVKIVDGARDFSLMSRRMIDAILSLKEKTRFSKGIFEWAGFKTKWLEFENVQRNAGGSKWSFWKLLAYSIEGIVSFSHYPLIFASIVGLLFCLLALVMVIVIIIRTLTVGDPVAGWPSLVCIILFVTGIQLLCAGILGIYISKIFVEVKNRPMYVIAETNICKNKSENIDTEYILK